MRNSRILVCGLFILTLLQSGCTRSAPKYGAWQPVDGSQESQSTEASPVDAIQTARPKFSPPTRQPGSPIYTPTPDSPHALPTPRTDPDAYTVHSGDTLGLIAQRYGVDLNTLIDANKLSDPDHLEVGQALTIPAPNPLPPGPDFKIIPNSELVYGPASVDFNIADFVKKTGGYLASYSEKVDDQPTSGVEIVARVAKEFSVNPRLLLAVLEYQGHWLSTKTPPDNRMEYPVGYANPGYKGLYRQLAFAANNLNRGYYLWKVNGIAAWILADAALVPPASTINAGTAAVQQFFSLLYGEAEWKTAVSENGLYATYSAFFGFPFDLAIEPLIPAELAQPALQLPFEKGDSWSFTGGPHAGWGTGSAWAAIDFAPPGDALGCVASNAWVIAAADGVIVRSEHGEVVEDLDGDGYEQTGWSLLYMHIETRDRVGLGKTVKAGDRIGHPSCEGGISNGTHVHFARRYNGEWIAADGSLPFNLDGWISKGDGTEYNGWLSRGSDSVEAWDSRKNENQISR